MSVQSTTLHSSHARRSDAALEWNGTGRCAGQERSMELSPPPKPKQTTVEFWKSYFAKLRHPIEDHEESETAAVPLAVEAAPTLLSSETRRLRRQRGAATRQP
jgi:hypothetical protein